MLIAAAFRIDLRKASYMKWLYKRKPCVLAGLVGTLSLGAVLAATPMTAVAEGIGQGVASLPVEAVSIESSSRDSLDNDCQLEITNDTAPDGSADLKPVPDPSGRGASFVSSSPSEELPDSTEVFDEDADSNQGVDSESDNNRSSDPAPGWTDDGNGYWDGAVNSDGTIKTFTGWVVDGHDGGLDRYWVQDGVLWRSGLMRASEGYWFYSHSSGHVLRNGYFEDKGSIYIADNDGRLAGGENGGWVVSDRYGQGLQRYWISSDHAAHEGYSADGWEHYTTGEGYVLRGTKRVNDNVYLADGDGRLIRGENKDGSGWVVSSAYRQGLQRYWVESGGYTRVGSSSAGWNHFTTEEGFVLRGGATLYDGSKVFADNDGKLKEAGWLVSSAFGQGLQRYWLHDSKVFAGGLFNAGNGWWGFSKDDGTVLRGKFSSDDGYVFIADNDGRLAGDDACGWVVSSGYGDGLQRYWIDQVRHAAKIGYSNEGWSHLTTEGGYVLRGKHVSGNHVFLSDNNGLLESGKGWFVTSKYDGHYERYWLDVLSDGSSAALTGFFDIEGSSYFGFGADGYVLRGAGRADGNRVFANNDGVLFANGWLVTNAFGDGLQRYWFRDSKVAQGLVSADEAGYWAYARPEGFVVRGKYLAQDGNVYLANNDGKLEDAGWFIGSVYDGSAQRYYIDQTTHAARGGYFMVGDERYLGLRGKGYVLRGTMRDEGNYVHANNDGELILSFNSSIKTGKDGVESSIVSTFVGDVPYLFLPSYADSSKFTLRYSEYEGMQRVSVSLDGGHRYFELSEGTQLNLSDVSDINGAKVLLFKVGEKGCARKLAVMRSASVRSMFLVSDDPVLQGRDYVDGSVKHSTKAKGTMLLVDPDGSVVYNGALSQIKGRGNTTWVASDKKPYQIKLDKKADLLETGKKDNKAKTWVLLANASDATLLRNTAALNMAQKLGLTTSPECAPVDLYYDGEYRGSYLLCEKVQINSGRVDIYDLEGAVEKANKGIDLGSLTVALGVNKYGQTFQYVQGMNTPAVYDGGYLLELDEMFYRSERCWFMSTNGIFVVKGPENCSYEMMRYISERMQETVDVCNESNVSPISGKTIDDCVDVDSFAKMLLLNEFSKNGDWSISSCYFYLPSSSDSANGYRNVFYAGPAWDFDAAFGTRIDNLSARPVEGRIFSFKPFACQSGAVVNQAQMIARSGFYNYVERELLGGAMKKSSLDWMRSTLSNSERMDFLLWGFKPFANCAAAFETYEENYLYLRNWISGRLVWLSNNWL